MEETINALKLFGFTVIHSNELTNTYDVGGANLFVKVTVHAPDNLSYVITIDGEMIYNSQTSSLDRLMSLILDGARRLGIRYNQKQVRKALGISE